MNYEPISVLAESLISRYFMRFLSTIHWMLITEKDLERIALPNSTSPLYNFSLYLNHSSNPADLALIDST